MYKANGSVNICFQGLYTTKQPENLIFELLALPKLICGKTSDSGYVN